MSAKRTQYYMQMLPGGICFAHGPYKEMQCPKWPACATDPQVEEYRKMGIQKVTEKQAPHADAPQPSQEQRKNMAIGHCPWDVEFDEEGGPLPEPHCHANREGDCNFPYCPQPLLKVRAAAPAVEGRRALDIARERDVLDKPWDFDGTAVEDAPRDWCDTCKAPQMVMPDGEHRCGKDAMPRTPLPPLLRDVVEWVREHEGEELANRLSLIFYARATLAASTIKDSNA